MLLEMFMKLSCGVHIIAYLSLFEFAVYMLCYSCIRLLCNDEMLLPRWGDVQSHNISAPKIILAYAAKSIPYFWQNKVAYSIA